MSGYLTIIEQFSIECRNNFLIALVLRCYALLLVKKFAPFSQPIRSKVKTNHDLLARVFPRLAPAACICFGF